MVEHMTNVAPSLAITCWIYLVVSVLIVAIVNGSGKVDRITNTNLYIGVQLLSIIIFLVGVSAVIPVIESPMSSGTDAVLTAIYALMFVVAMEMKGVKQQIISRRKIKWKS